MDNIKLTEKDICIIIATYNRAEDVKKSLEVLIKNKNIPGKIVIVDQSKDNKTKEVVKSFGKKIPIEYIYCNIPSADISMNMGIKKYREKFKLLLTAGDDVDFLENYMKEILKKFNNHPKIMAMGGADLKHVDYDFNSLKNKLSNCIFRLFFLPFKEDNKFRIVGSYGNTASPRITKDINDAEWIPGFNMCARSEVYRNYLWPEIRGYNVIDDIDSSHTIYKKYGKGSLLMTPDCKVIHRESPVARYVEMKRIFVNHEDHFSFYYLHFNNFKGTLKMMIELTAIIVGNFLKMIFKPNKNNLLNFIYNIKGIHYAFSHRKEIKNKQYRTFLNDDLSMKKL